MADKTEASDKFDQIMMAMQNDMLLDAGMHALIVPDGYRVEDMQRLEGRPRRVVADYGFVTVKCLSTYVNTHQADGTMLMADAEKGMIIAQIDGDAPSELGTVPSFKTHRAKFVARQSDIIKAWREICGKSLSQIDFGRFLESRAQDVVVPDSADVMEMVMKFEATKRVVFKSQNRLANGDRQLEYVEETNAVRGGIVLPDHIIVLAAVYRGQEPQRIKFWLRYKISDQGQLSFMVEMHDQEAVMREAFQACVSDFCEQLEKKDQPIYYIG